MTFKTVVNSRPLFWAVLAIPAAHLFYRFVGEDLLPDEMVGPTGEWAARFIIVALALTPLSRLLPGSGAVKWLLARRRALGVAAFCYALLHLAFYIWEMETLANMLAELGLAGIWTGWLALLMMIPLAATSNDAAVRALRSGWKRLQRLAYPAALLTLAHWILVHNGLGEAMLWFAPLGALQLWRIGARLRRRAPMTSNL